ncbi:MAG TPA: hypothetical protein VFN35_08345 [Ktedonobacteraceae bacterium]|nr:hypothetical protein [Ktedonobacteraceae bacterium]
MPDATGNQAAVMSGWESICAGDGQGKSCADERVRNGLQGWQIVAACGREFL